MGIILENKEILKLMSSKNVNNKKCAQKLIFFNEKKMRKISMILNIDHIKLILNVKFWHFLTLLHYTNSQNAKFLFGYVDF